MTTAGVTLQVGNTEFEFTAEADTTTTRAEGTWCDGPIEVEVHDVTLYHAATGKEVRKPFLNLLSPHMDYVIDCIAEAHGQW